MKQFQSHDGRTLELSVNSPETVRGRLKFGDPSKEQLLAGDGEILYLGSFAHVVVRLEGNGSAQDYTIETAMARGGTLREADGIRTSGRVADGEVRDIWISKSRAPYLALGVSDSNLRFDLYASESPPDVGAYRDRQSNVGVSTASSWTNRLVSVAPEGFSWKETRPTIYHPDSDNSANKIQARIRASRREGIVGSGSLSDSDVNDDSKFETVISATEADNTAIQSGGVWPNLSGSAMELDAKIVALQLKEASGGAESEVEIYNSPSLNL